MKNVLYRLLLPQMALVALSCTKDVVAEQEIVVDYATVSGVWQMTQWCGEAVGSAQDDTRYFYMDINMSADESGKHCLVLYENLNSSKSHKLESVYRIVTDDSGNAVILGYYEYGAGAWEHEFVISELTVDSMTWTALDESGDVRVFIRCESVPEDIVAGTKSAY
ncbi:MAG: hypothetical protein ACI4TM_00510 [Candidatus Cryptobacteroides sp.]